MYTQLRNPFGLTENEALWDRVTFDRLKEFIQKCDKVVSSSRGANTYGEFRFVTLVIGNYALVLYGHGWHGFREQYLGKWHIHLGHYWKEDRERPGLDKGKVLEELDREAPDYETVAQARSHAAYLFSTLAEMGDEDGAYTELQDLGYI